MSVAEICQGLPIEFETFLGYCKSLHFEGKPDYKYLRKLLSSLAAKHNIKYDALFDWTLMHMSPQTVATHSTTATSTATATPTATATATTTTSSTPTTATSTTPTATVTSSTLTVSATPTAATRLHHL
eukprot:TRINITY_DN1673_c0_g3_i1.p1 TRINITY_DN1673_c0_g3~~TRINITY_DN1673_c0_g3_i1.p1  ORF type:complete len:128 (-),score=29.40 TRINITY_DN1673_c0_g3_i1:62-445(-)